MGVSSLMMAVKPKHVGAN